MSDSRDLAHVENGPPPVRQSDSLLQQVIAAAKDPSVDAAKMEALVKLVNSQQDRDREIEFNQSKNAAIKEMPVITKDGRIVITKDGASREQGRFARFEDIDRVVRPILQRHNLAIAFDVEERQGGGIVVRPILTHTNGFTERGGGMPLPADQSGGKNAVQAVGSALQYGKRYTMCAMLNIQTEGADNDGNGARGAIVSLPFEREQVVLADAQQAHEQGRYLEWFTQQPPKDRGWLVSSGKHEAFGGQPMLPAGRSPAAAATVDQSQQGSTPAPASTATPAATKPKAQTPREWVDKLKKDVEACVKVDDLALYMDEARESLDKLKAKHEALWQECQDAYQQRRETLESGALL